MDTIAILQILIGIIIFIMLLLVVVYIYLIRPKVDKSITETSYNSNNGENATQVKKVDNFGRFQGQVSQSDIFNFMEFDEIVDNMIVRKNKTQYVMVLQCNGINYDLMSEQEKISVEEGFIQFLNTLRFPIQLYVQSRTLNLKDIVGGYREKMQAVSDDIDKLKVKINHAKKENNLQLKEKLEFEKRRKENVLTYGSDLTEYVDRLNGNKNILQQKTYLIVSYYVSELGENMENYSREEIDNMCFSELYTRAQNLASSLSSSQVISRVLDSEELAELLYVAYNRDESEVYTLSKALEAEYDSLYSTGKDVLKKKQEKLDKEINIAAIDLATDSILKADKQKELEEIEAESNKIHRIKKQASELIDMYEEKLDKRVFEIAKENVEKFEGDKKKIQKVKALDEKVKSKEKSGKKTIVKKKKSTEKTEK